MKNFINWLDSAPLWLKIIFALPVLDIVWAVYRIAKGVDANKISLVIAGIFWLILGWIILWVVDIISISVYKKPLVLT